MLPSLFFSLLFAVFAFAEREKHIYNGSRNHDGYFLHYEQANQGRRNEWSEPDLGSVTLCLEVDTETGGERHRMVVEDSHCPVIEVKHQWTAPESGRNSECYKVDAITSGLRFRRPANDRQCEKPPVAMAWITTENEAKPGCYEVDAASGGQKYRRPLPSRRCPHTLDSNLAFGRKEPLLKEIGGRMPASLAKPIPVEEESPGERSEFWEDPEDMIQHVPERSRKGY